MYQALFGLNVFFWVRKFRVELFGFVLRGLTV